MKTKSLVAMLCLGASSVLHAQTQTDAQIRAAIAPLPDEFRDSATVLGHVPGKQSLQTLRRGTGPFVCLADDPSDQRFHVACYHEDLEPFMARGRELRAKQVTNVDSARFADIDAGRLSMPKHPAALYSLTGKPENVSADGTVTGARRLYVVYIPFATARSTGLATKPAENMPWIMFPGTAKAHIMFVPTM